MRTFLLSLYICCVCCTSTFAQDTTLDYTQTWLGVGDVFYGPIGDEPVAFGVEFGFGFVSHELSDASVLVNLHWIAGTDAAPGFMYSYSGLRISVLALPISVSVGVAVGYFNHFSRQWPDLGSSILFREDIQLSVPVAFGESSTYLFIGVAHLSNAGLGDINPGLELLYIGFGTIL